MRKFVKPSLEEIRRLNNELDMPLSGAEGAKVENGERRAQITARRALAVIRRLGLDFKIDSETGLHYEDPEGEYLLDTVEIACRVAERLNLTPFESKEAVRVVADLITKCDAWANDVGFAWVAIEEVCKANKQAFEDLKAVSDIVGAENFRDTLSSYVSLIGAPDSDLTQEELGLIRMGFLRLKGRRLRLVTPEDDVPLQ